MHCGRHCGRHALHALRQMRCLGSRASDRHFPLAHPPTPTHTHAPLLCRFQNVTHNVMSWGERWAYTAAGLAPLVSAYKVQGGTLQGHCPPLTAPSPFRATDSGAPAGCRLCCQLLEPRHLVHLVNRFENNRTDSVHTAFLNGIGYESWENIWVGTSCYSASRGRTPGYVVVVLWSLWLHCSVSAFIS
jgi:hypothetical protein